MLNSFLKHGIIVGVVTFLMSLMLMISEISIVCYILTPPVDYVLPFIVIIKHLGSFLFAFTSAILSGIMIWGIAKKRHTLLVPWLVFFFVIFVLATFTVFYITLTRSFNELDDFTFCFFIVGFGVILIYPIYILYIEIHMQNMLSVTESQMK